MSHVHVRQSQKHMATTFTFTVSVPPSRVGAARQALGEAHALVARLEDELSEFRPHTPVARFNGAGVGEWVPFTIDGMAVWREAESLSQRTGGAFSPLAKSRPGARLEDVEQSELGLRKRQGGVWLGFGAIGKGFALDQARALLERAGLGDFILSAGGSSQVLSGFAAPGMPWTWGWSWKRDADGDDVGIALEHATGRPTALGVSGFHEKGRHLLDPRRGIPVEEWAKSACVAGDSATECDALSTALLVGGWDEVAADMGKAIIDREERPRWNERFTALWRLARNSRFASLWRVPVLCLLLGVALSVGRPARADEAMSSKEEAVDLNALGVQDFTPYALERHPGWALLPLFSLFLVLAHLRREPRRRKYLKTVLPQTGESHDRSDP